MAFAGTASYTVRLVSTSTLAEKVARSLGTVLPTVGNQLANDSTATIAATKIDTFCRALNRLTTNTYRDAEVTGKASVDEILAEG